MQDTQQTVPNAVTWRTFHVTGNSFGNVVFAYPGTFTARPGETMQDLRKKAEDALRGRYDCKADELEVHFHE